MPLVSRVSYTARQSVPCAALWHLQWPCRGVQRHQLGIQCNRLAQSSFSLNWTPEQRRVSQLVQARLKRRLEHAHCLGMRWLSRTARVERIYTSSEAAMLPNHHSSFKRALLGAHFVLCLRALSAIFSCGVFFYLSTMLRLRGSVKKSGHFACIYVIRVVARERYPALGTHPHPGPGHHRDAPGGAASAGGDARGGDRAWPGDSPVMPQVDVTKRSPRCRSARAGRAG